MARRSLIEQLDEAVKGLLDRRDALLPEVNARIAPLVRVAAELRDLPREEFKARLKDELGGRKMATITEAKVSSETPRRETISFIRPGFRTVTPYIMVYQAAQLIDFVKQAFGAEELYRGSGGGGGTHCEVRIGDSMMMLGGGGAWKGPERTAAIHLYVKDADAAYQRAMEAGATSLRVPEDQFYGDREGSVKDPFGNHWYIGTNKQTGAAPIGMNSVTPSFHPKGAGKMIEFLKNAFRAEEISRAQSPSGHVHYAQVRIGSSVIDMGEAHGEFQPMPTSLYLYVEDADALYHRALQAGATSLHAPADQPYGDRNGGVLDPFGNEWFISTHVQDVS
jgi:PhnB protein